VDGPGVLQALASADPRGEDSFVDDKCHTFEGRALAIIRPTGAGEITLTVEAGDRSSSVTIDSEEPSALG